MPRRAIPREIGLAGKPDAAFQLACRHVASTQVLETFPYQTSLNRPLGADFKR